MKKRKRERREQKAHQLRRHRQQALAEQARRRALLAFQLAQHPEPQQIYRAM